MHVHILGICGTFMGGIAAIAKALGHTVTGSDSHVYPPMSTQLEALGIELSQLDDLSQFEPQPDIVVIGNALSRGAPAVEYVLSRKLPYTSGPQWLQEHLLNQRWVLAASGTHGKTTTSAMLAWILEYAGLKPGFLIGGVPENFGISARVGDSPFFVIEADEYDSAFFDKRSKFVHYRPDTLIINNLEYDHADIFDDLAAIQRQFHHLVRTVPNTGLILSPQDSQAIKDTLNMGCWSPQQQFKKHWQTHLLQPDGSEFEIAFMERSVGTVRWSLIGLHNLQNAVMAVAAAHHAGVPIAIAIEALAEFKNVKRRMEVKAQINGVTLYDDFAHHPTAIATTLDGLRQKVGKQRIIAILEPRSNTMKMGVHTQSLVDSWQQADEVLLLEPKGLNWSLSDFARTSSTRATCYSAVDEIINAVKSLHRPNDHILVMSNGGFDNIHARLIAALEERSV